MVFLFIAGVYFTVFGSRLLFQKGFVEKLREGIWKEKNDHWPEKEGYNYDKYIRGISFLAAGLISLALAIFTLFY